MWNGCKLVDVSAAVAEGWGAGEGMSGIITCYLTELRGRPITHVSLLPGYWAVWMLNTAPKLLHHRLYF